MASADQAHGQIAFRPRPLRSYSARNISHDPIDPEMIGKLNVISFAIILVYRVFQKLWAHFDIEYHGNY